MDYAEKYGVTKAAVRYRTNRQYIYRWRKRYDGTLKSLEDRSHRPHSHPNQHTEAELKLIGDMRRRNPNAGIVAFWVKLWQRGYTRSIPGLYRVLRRQGEMAVKLPNPKYIPKPYEQMEYPGQRCQIDVKFVPKSCIVGQEEGVQTDNGSEFTNKLNSSSHRQTLFEKALAELGIRHKLIRPYTPRHNGKVERNRRKDNEKFYASHKFFSFADFASQLAVRQRQYNNFPIRPLSWRSPSSVLSSFPSL